MDRWTNKWTDFS